MNITTDFILFWLAIMVPLFAGICSLWSKLDKIWSVIAKIEKEYVEHNVCQSHRDRCPCVEHIKEIKETIKQK